jgi:MFS family permease
MHGLAMGSALYGTVIASLLGGWPTDKFGRKPTLLFIGVLYILSAVGCAFANGVSMFIAARVIGGIGITNLIFTFVGLWLIDRLGRRTLLYIGSFGYIASLGLTAWAFFTQHFAILPACIYLHLGSRRWSGRGHLGAHFGNLPKPPPSRRASARQLHPLAFCGVAYDIFPDDSPGFCAGLCGPFFLRYDGVAAHLG